MALPTFNGWNIVAMPNSKFAMIDWTSSDTVGANTSLWTSETQTYDWQSSFLSATVTIPPQQGASAAAWAAFPLACRGMLNPFILSDSSQAQPLGAIGTNLAPDPGFQMPLGLLWSQPDDNWWIAPGAGYLGSNALTVAAADSGKGVYSLSGPIPVVAGQSYRISAYINGTPITSAVMSVTVCNAMASVDYASLAISPGQFGQFSAAFTVPGGVTQAYIQCAVNNAVFPSGSTVSFSAISLTAGAPAVNGANQSGYSLVTNGWPPSTSNLLLIGDYITIMSAPVNSGDISIPRLYRVTQPVSSDGSGNATLSIWPPIREKPASGTAMITSNTSGLFRLTTNQNKWNKNYDGTMSLSFPCTEAL